MRCIRGPKYPYHAQAQSLPVTAYSHCAVVFLDVEKQTLIEKYLVSTA